MRKPLTPSKISLAHLRARDPILARLISRVSTLDFSHNKNYFESLTHAIIGQQLSEKAATTITNRFNDLFPKRSPTPALVLGLTDKKIRAAGLSGSKTLYIKEVARAFHNGLNARLLERLDDESVIVELTKIKGIGRWTAEMFLIFSLGREDVFSHGDGGLQRAIRQLYTLRTDPSKATLEKITKRWQPYRSFACLYLWASLDAGNMYDDPI